MRKKEELDLYIEEHIMNHVNYRRKIDPKTNEEYYEGTCQLHFLTRSTITEEELEYIFNTLNRKDILVVGDSPVLYGDFDNYRYVRKTMYRNQIELYDAEKCSELLYKFKTMKVETEEEKLEYDSLRKKIVSMNVRFVDFIVDRLNSNGEFSRDELASYGYEGLIIAVDNFDMNKGGFSMYIKKCIQGNVIKGMKSLKGFPSKYFYYKYENAKKMVEEELEVTIEDDLEYLDEIATKIYLQCSLPLDTLEQIKSKIALINVLSLEEIEDQFYDDNTLYREVIESVNSEYLKKDIDKAMSNLTFRQQENLINRYGLKDGIYKSYKEVAKIMGCQRQNIQEMEKKILKKLKNTDNIDRLEEYYSSIGEYDYNPCGIETVKIKQKVK